MTEIVSAAQQLEALALVWRLALTAKSEGVRIGDREIPSDCAEAIGVLRRRAEAQQEREHRLGQAFARGLGWEGDADSPDRCTEYGETIGRAIASVGAEIVWPSPDSAETPERSAEARTAPGIDTVSVTVPHCQKNPGCCAPNGHSGVCWVMTNASVSELAGREKILAEVATSDAAEELPRLVGPHYCIEAAFKRAKKPVVRDDDEFYSRDNLIAAAAILVHAVERMDAADE